MRSSRFRLAILNCESASSGKWIDEEDLTHEINEPDAYALEEGLQLKEKHGGEVVALCFGPARAAQTIREALAKGADRAIHIEDENPGAYDPLAAARLMAAALKAEAPDLVLTGLQSDDLGYGQTGPILAELLGLPHATIIMEVEKQDGAIRVKRELEDGWFQHVEMPLPALLTIQSGISKLRYATLMGIKKAKTKEIRRLTPAELGAATGAPSIPPGARLPAGARQTDAALRGQSGGGRRQTGGETEIRGAGHMSILVVMEQRAGEWNRMSFETLAAAQQLAGELDTTASAAVLGQGVDALAAELAGKQLDKVYAVRARTAEGVHAGRLVQRAAPTHRARQAGLRAVPAHLPGSRLSAEARHRDGQGGGQRRGGPSRGRRRSDLGPPAFPGQSERRRAFRGRRAALRVAAGRRLARRSTRRRRGRQSRSSAPPSPPPISVASRRTRFRESARAVDLTAAELIVAVGRGIKEADNIPLVQELADVLGAELAASRPICDAGWLPMERQVGSSGQTVGPKMYMAIGISGAIQHLVGMKGARTIVAINKDPNAPIFEVADYGIVGDLFQVVPALIEAFKKAK